MSSENVLMIDGRSISDMKVVDLKKELDLRGLDKKGNKKDLYERLRDYLLQQNAHKSSANQEEAVSLF